MLWFKNKAENHKQKMTRFWDMLARLRCHHSCQWHWQHRAIEYYYVTYTTHVVPRGKKKKDFPTSTHIFHAEVELLTAHRCSQWGWARLDCQIPSMVPASEPLNAWCMLAAIFNNVPSGRLPIWSGTLFTYQLSREMSGTLQSMQKNIPPKKKQSSARVSVMCWGQGGWCVFKHCAINVNI